MTLWRDPLDELIDDLERALPAEAGPAQFEPLPPSVGLQLWVQAILYGTPEERARVEQDPRVKANKAYLEKLARRLHGDGERRPDRPPSEKPPE